MFFFKVCSLLPETDLKNVNQYISILTDHQGRRLLSLSFSDWSYWRAEKIQFFDPGPSLQAGFVNVGAITIAEAFQDVEGILCVYV